MPITQLRYHREQTQYAHYPIEVSMKNQTLSLLAVVSACLLALFGCAPSSDSGGSGDNSTSVLFPESDSGGSGDNSTSVLFPELEGKWTSSCTQSWDMGPSTGLSWGEGVILSLEISGAELTAMNVYYSNVDCSGSEVSKEVRSYSNLAGNSVDTGGAKNYKTSMKIQKFEITPLNGTSKDEMNTRSYCGVNSWENNTPLDALGKTCRRASGLEFMIPPKDTTIYNEVNLTGNRIRVVDYGTDNTYSTALGLPNTPAPSSLWGLSYQKQ